VSTSDAETNNDVWSGGENHFRTLVENHPLPVIFVVVETGLVVYESPAASKMFGREPNSDVAFHVQELYADPMHRSDFVEKLRRDGELRDYPIHYRRADGSTYWISCTTRLINIDGREMHITSMLDLTEQRERENALKQANETLEDAIESLAEGFALFGADNRLITCNSRFEEYNDICHDILKPGVTFEELVRTGSERGEYYGEGAELDLYLQSHYDADGNRRAVREFEFRLQKQDQWLLYSNHPTRQNGFVITLTDITRSKTLEKALRDSEESVRLILEASPTPITVSRGEDSVVMYESPVSRELFMRTEDETEAVARDYWVDPKQRDATWQKLKKAGEIRDQEVQFRKLDGSLFWGAFSARLLNHRDEDLIVSTVHDLTETKAMQEEMARQRDVLHISEKMVAMGELLASVSHELNNPLSVVVGQTLLLKETANDPAVAARAERIGKAADRCARIVKTFLAMARQQPGERVQTDPNGLIDMALELTGYSLRGAHIEVATSLGRTLPEVRIDPDQITQVLTNLIMNAEHALREQEGARTLKITSRYSAADRHVVIKVKDNGPGIAADIRRRIFEPFFTTKEQGVGTGIGLALCHRLIEANDGKIKLASQMGQGASFTIRLPVDGAPADSNATAPDERASAAPLSVLVIDDEPEVAQLIADILELDGHATVMADNGRTALELLGAQDFDIILSDLRMPGFDGPWLFGQMQESRPELLDRIAFITGDTLSGDIAAFLQQAGRPFIEKPITPDDVRKLVSSLIEA